MANFRCISLTLGLCILFSAHCAKASTGSEPGVDEASGKLPVCTILIQNKVKVTVEVASNDATRQKGLMFRKSLPHNHGMLFVFQNEENLNFWMKNTYIPLDIAYISKTGIINETYYMKPLDTSITYPATKPALYALEMAAGWFKENNIIPGNRINFNGCFSK